MPAHELERLAVELEEEMIAAADDLRFEYAAQLRDELRELRRDLAELGREGARPSGPSGAPAGASVGPTEAGQASDGHIA